MAGAGYLLFTAGQVLTAAQVNTFLMQQSNMVFATTAARDAALSAVKSEGMITYQLDNNDLDIYNGTLFGSLIAPANGVWTTYVPVVVQGATPTITNLSSVYMRIARLIIGRFTVQVTSAGTAANLVTVSLPVAASTADSNTKVGTGLLFDASGPLYYNNVTLSLNSTTTVKFTNLAGGAPAETFLGTTTFTAALASGDVVLGTFWYEAAADA